MKQSYLNNEKVFEEIQKGWSSDRKYYVETVNEEKLLLRVVSLEMYEHKKKEFAYMKALTSLGIPISQPLSFWREEDAVHMLFTWAEGHDAEHVLPQLDKEQQYHLGYEAGTILRKIHTLPASGEIEEWENVFNRKIDRNIRNYQACELKYANGSAFLEYIEANRHLLKDRPQTFQHGDYHTGNMILSNENKLTIIDFNRWSNGDPWEEFNRIDFTARVSPAFASGNIDGYFQGEPPELFFKLLALYSATNCLNALPWALDYSEKEVEIMLNKGQAILESYDGMKKVIPSWYTGEFR